MFLQQKSVPNAKIGFSKAMQAGWIEMDKKAEGGPKVFRKVNITYKHIHDTGTKIDIIKFNASITCVNHLKAVRFSIIMNSLFNCSELLNS